ALMFSGIFVGLLQRRFPIRHIMLVGSILVWAGILTSGFATSTQWLILTMGVIHGTGFGIMYVTMRYFAMLYFDKLRGVAMGITSFGISIAGFVFPKVLLYLGDTYSFLSSLFILGAFSMNITPLAYLLKVPPWHKLTKQCESAASTYPSSFTCATEKTVHQQEIQSITSFTKSLPNYSWTLSSMVRLPIFHVLVLSAAVSHVFEICFMSSLTDLCQDRGLTTNDAVWLTSCFGLTDIIGRMFLPLLADKGLLRRSTLLMLLHLFMATVMMAAPCATTYSSLAAIEAFSAFLHGSGAVMYDVLAVEYFGLEKLPTM
ncbi:monocarboxylate transporter, putative, partial [Ixodes scapularis]